MRQRGLVDRTIVQSGGDGIRQRSGLSMSRAGTSVSWAEVKSSAGLQRIRGADSAAGHRFDGKYRHEETGI